MKANWTNHAALIFPLILCCVFSNVSFGQSPSNPLNSSPGVKAGQPKSQADYSYQPGDSQNESQKIWESDEMLEARAWLEDYFKRSAKISDAQGKKYLEELRAMSPDQMKLWLIKFHQERDRRIAEGKRWRQTNRKALELQTSSPQVGGFRNPYAGQSGSPYGLSSSQRRPTIGGQSNPLAQRPTVKKPFSSPKYQQSVRPLVTSQEAARFEVLRGLGAWHY